MERGQSELPEAGLRERKKRQTRATIAAVGRELFAAQGFHETTIKQIADAADVSARTVSSYFPAKEEIVFAEHEEISAELASALATRPQGESTADALARWLASYVSERAPDEREMMRCTKQIAASDPALRTYELGLQEQAKQIIAASMATDLGLPPDHLLPRMVGAATMAALDSLDGGTLEEPTPEEARKLIDQTMSFIGAGVRELADTDQPIDGEAASPQIKDAGADAATRP